MMICSQEYKIVLGKRTANEEELDAVSDITVEQTAGMIWEGIINLSINANEQGIWNINEKDFSNPQFRARIEVKDKDNSFLPLIDGPVVSSETDLRSEPGLSSMKLVINDDSILLNKDEEILTFANKKDSNIAKQIYNLAVQHGILGSLDSKIEETSGPPDTINFRGTRMQLLHKLAMRNQIYAYVLPGDKPGKSMGCFNHSQSSSLADLVLLGENRNIENLKVNINTLKPSIVKNSVLNPVKRDTESQVHIPKYQASEFLGDIPVIQNDGRIASNVIHPSLRLFHPASSFSCNSEQLAKGQANKSGYSVEATGELLGVSAYPDIMRPYHYVTIRASNSVHSGNYFIIKVTHKISPSGYTQSFTLIRNALSDLS